MPLYEYQCGRCGRFELIRKFSDAPLTLCPTCNEPVTKLLSAPAIQFKGTGWYITDYARKSGGGGESKDKGSKDAGGTKDAGSSKETSTSSKETSSSSESSSSSTPKPPSKDTSATGSGSK